MDVQFNTSYGTYEILTDLSATQLDVSADQILDKVFAVHATRCLPDSDYIHAGLATNGLTPLQKAFLPQARTTLHFALGELVRPVEGVASWEDCPYALVTTVRNLLPQLININCYDTFILGDLKLDSKTYLVLPEDAALNIRSDATLVTYNPNQKTLREAVDDLIALKKGWHIQMNSDDVEDRLHSAYLENENINTFDFFESLKKERPWLATGLRFDSLDGEHYRLSQIEQGLLTFALSIYPLNNRQENDETVSCDSPTLDSSKRSSCSDVNPLESSQIKSIITQLNHHFKKWTQSLNGFNWCAESQKAYQNIQFEIKRWTLLMNEELRLRKVYGKTLTSASEDTLAECIQLLNQPEKLKIYLDQNHQNLVALGDSVP